MRRIVQPASVQLQRYPTQAMQVSAPVEALRSLDFVPTQARRSYRQYFGRAISLDRIEVSMRAAWRGNMRPLTDIARETLDTDPHLASVVNKRVGALSGLPWEVHPASGYKVDEAKAHFYANVVREQLSSLRNFRQSLRQLAWALFDGRSALEMRWVEVASGMAMGKYRVTMALEKMGWIHPRRLSFGPMRELRVTDEYVGLGGDFGSYGLALDALPFKFVSWTPQLFGEYPEREGLAPRCLYWSFFKRFGARERMILLELFGKPWRIVEVDPDSPAGSEDLRSVDEIVDALGSSYSARLPRGVSLNVVQPQRTAGAIHDDVIRESDRQISKLVLGQTGTTDEVKGGFNNQQANVMQDEQLALLNSDARALEEVIEDQITDAIISLNFGESEVIHAPKFVLRGDLPLNRTEELARLKAALEAGLAISLPEAYQVSGFRVPEEDVPVLRVDQPPTEPNSPVAPAPRAIVVYPAGKSPAVGEQQPLPPVAAVGPGAATAPAASTGAAMAGETIKVNEDRAARGLPPLTTPSGELHPDGNLTVAEYAARRKRSEESVAGAAGGETMPPGSGTDPNPKPGNEPTEDDIRDPIAEAPRKRKGKAADAAKDEDPAVEEPPRPGEKPGDEPVPQALLTGATVSLYVRHEGSKWVVYSEAGKHLGEYDTEADAEERLRQIEYYKHRDAAASALTRMAGPLGEEAAAAVSLSMMRTAALAAVRAEIVALSAIGDAKQPRTEHGSPDDLIDRGEAEGRRATAAFAAHFESAVRGKTTPHEIYSALATARQTLDVHPLARAAERRMVQASALGALDASLALGVTASDDPPKAKGAEFSKTPYDAALRDFKKKNVVRKEVFAKLETTSKQRAFTVAGVAADDMLSLIHDELVSQVSSGADLRSFAEKINDRMKAAGWVASPQVLGDGSRVMGASHVENVFRTNVLGAYNAGRKAQMSEPEVVKKRPVWEWRTVGDPHVRPNHAQAHGLRMLATDPAWQRIYPPGGFRCRCRVVSLGPDAVGTVVDGSTVTYLPDQGFTAGFPPS